MVSHQQHWRWVALSGFVAAAMAASCAASSDTSIGSTSTNSGGGGTGGEGGIGGAGGTLSVASVGGSGGDPSCIVLEEEATARPLNLYIVYDKSSSMVGSKWDNAKLGLTAFVDDPESAGVRVALRFFPRPVDATPACDMNGYKEPSVPYGVLPGNAQAIKDAIDAEAPNGFSTPIFPALGGALLKGIDVAQQNPTEASAVLLVTDGQPQGPAPTCAGVDPEDPNQIAMLASNGMNFNPPVLTYVVGLPGVDQTSANIIAQGGGSDSAIFVGATNVAVEFQNALAEIRGKALPCVYDLPASVVNGDIAITKVNVEVTPGQDGGDPYLLSYDPTCVADGWRYDNADTPTVIELCSATCQTLKADFGAKVKVVLGCDTVIK